MAAAMVCKPLEATDTEKGDRSGAPGETAGTEVLTATVVSLIEQDGLVRLSSQDGRRDLRKMGLFGCRLNL